MRRFLIGCLFLLAFAGSSSAAVYNIDPRVGATTVSVASFGSTCPTSCTTATESPLYTFSAGDVLDFGTLTLGSIYGSDGHGTLFRYDPIVVSAFGSLTALDLNHFFTPTAACISSCANFLIPPPNQTFNLTFTLPASGQIQLAWQGNIVSYAPAVPEPATWALMLIGFSSLAFIGFIASHKRDVIAA